MNNEYYLSKELDECHGISGIIDTNINTKFCFIDWYISPTKTDLHYFRILDKNPIIDIPTKSARINILDPNYIICTDDGLESWILNKEEKDKLIKIFTSAGSGKRSNLSIWECFISDYKELLTLEKISTDIINKDIKLPNYLEL